MSTAGRGSASGADAWLHEHLHALHHLTDGASKPNYVQIIVERMNAELTVRCAACARNGVAREEM